LAAISLPLAAQYAQPPGGFGQTTVGFFATGKTSQLAATTTSSSVALSLPVSSISPQIQVYNTGTTTAYVACDGPAITVSAGSAGTATSDYPVGAGAIVVFSAANGASYCAGIYGTGSGTIYFTPGSGL
jgi:hypothetical protein